MEIVNAMATDIKLSDEQAETNRTTMVDFCRAWNDKHDDTFASYQQLPGGNVILTIEKIPDGSMGTEVDE